MKTLVTGGAGFIGSHLCEKLLALGHEVIAVDNLSCGREANLKNLKDHPKFNFEKTDILNKDALHKSFEGVEWVFHLAGIADIVPSIENPTAYFDVNVKGTLNVAECAKNSGVKRLVYAASSSSYGIPDVCPTSELSPINPLYPYALTKHMGEEIILHWGNVYNLPAVSLRLFNVYGPRSRTTGSYGAVFGVFLAQKIKDKPYTVVGDGKQTRDFTFVTDVAEAFIKAAQSDLIGEAMNVGSGNHYSVNRLVELLQGEKVYIPKRPGEPDCTFADIKKITRLLDWQPRVSFEEGVQTMLENLRDWEDAPVWDPSSIEKATEVWFRHLESDNANA